MPVKIWEKFYCRSYWSTIMFKSIGQLLQDILIIQLKDMLLLKKLQTWINIRANSSIKTWINVIKRKSAKLYSRSSIAQKLEPALRKTLQQSTKWHLFHKTSTSFLKSTLQGFFFVEIFSKFPKFFFGNPFLSARDSILKL